MATSLLISTCGGDVIVRRPLLFFADARPYSTSGSRATIRTKRTAGYHIANGENSRILDAPFQGSSSLGCSPSDSPSRPRVRTRFGLRYPPDY